MADRRLIDANALKWNLNVENAVKYGNETPEQLYNSYATMMRYEIANYIDNAPTIDAVPVVHGRWEKVQVWKDNPQTTLRCSLCKTQQPIYEHEEWKFCPFCGQPMDGGAE